MRITRHARNRMRRDHVTESEITECLESPDSLLDSINGRKNYIRIRGGSRLRVTAIEEDGEMVIITVTRSRVR